MKDGFRRAGTIALLALIVCGCASRERAGDGQSPVAAKSAAPNPAAAPEGSIDYSAERYRVVTRPDEIVSVLYNGATVITRRVDSPACAVRAYTRTGSVYEGPWLGGGLSHLLEHLVAGGSNGRRTERQNLDLLQQIGNNFNAYTTDDHTSFYVDTTTAHMEQAVDLVTGWMLTASITPEEYRREYQVVQRELEMGRGEPDRQFAYLTMMNRYRVSPARVPTIGYEEVIQGLSRDDVFAYYKLAYQINNLVFVVAGDLDPELMLKTVQKYVHDAKPGREFSRDIPEEPPVVSPRTVVATFPKLGQAKLDLSFPSVRLTSPDLYALDLLAAVLGQSESSILVQEIRDKHQLVSGISCSDSTPTYVDGSFSVSMELDPDKVKPATDAVLAVLDRAKSAPLDSQRIARAKTLLRANHIKSMQTSDAIASDLATNFMFTGDPHFTDLYIDRIEKVSAEQLQDAARRYLDPQKLLTTAMIPSEVAGAEALPKAEDLIRAAAPSTRPATTQPAKAVITRLPLDNGVILLHKQITTTPLVVISMYGLGGLTAEDAKTNGLGNLTMEMLPRGTTTRSAGQISEFFDSIGGDLATSCGNNSWTWGATCLKNDFPQAMEVFADVVNNPSFPQAEVAPMKQRVLAAIDGMDAQWDAQAYRFFKEQYFGPTNSPYQFLPIGSKKNVQSFSAEQMRSWYDEKVRGSRRVLAIFGDVDLEQARALASHYLGTGTPATEPASIARDERKPAADTGASINVLRVEVQKTEQPLAGVVIGFNSDSVIGGPASYTFDVADTLCSGFGYPGGYLFDTLRGRGLVYTVDAQNVPGRDAKLPGAFIVQAGCDPQKVNEVIDLSLLNIARLQGSPADIQESWFARSKQLIIASDALDHETPSAQAAQAAIDELYGLGYDHHANFVGRINAVTLSQVQALARSRLSSCVITVSTPSPELVNKKTGVREYSSFPPVELIPKGIQHDAGGK